MKSAIYARVSTFDQEPENQLAELRRYAGAREWTSVEYIDRGVSGAKDRRPALDQLLTDARRRRFDVVVVWRLDRLGRNLRRLIVLLEELQALGIAFVSLNEGIDATTPAGKLVWTARLPIPAGRFNNPEALNAHFDQIADRIQSLPGIRDGAFAEGLPTEGTPFGRRFQIADQRPVDRAQRPSCGFKTVSPSYFPAVGLHMLKGRALADRDRDGAPPVVVINDTFARLYFPDGDPIGKRLLMEAAATRGTNVVDDVAWEVVGVVADEGVSWNGKAEAVVYGTRKQNPSAYLALVVRGTLDPTRLQETIRKAVSAFDQDQALANMRSLDQLKTEYMASDRVRSMLLGTFAAIAVALAAIGLYGVIAYAVVQRTREIGIRAALGASRASLVALVVRQGMMMTGWGLVLGLAAALGTSRLLTALLSGLSASDPKTIEVVAGLLAGVAMVACYLPARRAAMITPTIALRDE